MDQSEPVPVFKTKKLNDSKPRKRKTQKVINADQLENTTTFNFSIEKLDCNENLHTNTVTTTTNQQQLESVQKKKCDYTLNSTESNFKVANQNVEAREQPADNFLLAYTYFLDKFLTTHITIGFDCVNHEPRFEPFILIRQTGNSNCNQIKITPIEWCTYFLNIQENNKYSINNKNSLNVNKCDKLIQLKQKKVTILTTLDAYNTLLSLSFHINEIIMHYVNCKRLISDYYKLIVTNFVKRDVNITDYSSEYVIVENSTRNIINYKRLFHEMITFYSSKIQKDVFFKKISIDIKEDNSNCN